MNNMMKLMNPWPKANQANYPSSKSRL